MEIFENSKAQPFLLPRYFKGIGIAVILLLVCSIIFLKLFNPELLRNNRQTFTEIVPSIGIVGLFFFASSKDFREDEMSNMLRLRTIGFVFLLTVLYVVIQPLIHTFFGSTERIMGAQHLVFVMLIAYIILFFTLKNWRR